MPQATQAAFDARVGVDDESLAGIKPVSAAASGEIRIAIHDDLTSVEREWRAFEQIADCTVFSEFLTGLRPGSATSASATAFFRPSSPAATARDSCCV